MKSARKIISLFLAVIFAAGVMPFAPVYAEPDSSPQNAQLIVKNEITPVFVSGGELTYLRFVPDLTGEYAVFSVVSETYESSCCYLYDENMNLITEDTNYNGVNTDNGSGFRIVRELTEGETYYFGVRFMEEAKSGTLNVAIGIHCNHIDENSDGFCDVCQRQLVYPFSINELKTVPIFAGDSLKFVFTSPVSGKFNWSQQVIGGQHVYKSNGEEISYYDKVLVAGNSYEYVLTARNGYDYVVDASITMVCDHTDADGDGVCDTCNATVCYTVEEDEPLRIFIPTDETRRVRFDCQRSGSYHVTAYEAGHGRFDFNIWDSEGHSMWHKDYFEAGKSYYLEGKNNSPVYSVITLFVSHNHIQDENGKCKICGKDMICSIGLGESKTIDIAPGETLGVSFDCEITGEYYYRITGQYEKKYIIGSNGYSNYNVMPHGDEYEEGVTYTLYISNNRTTVSPVTVYLGHNHTDNNNDRACDICSTVYRIGVDEGELYNISFPEGENRFVEFECPRTGEYTFNVNMNSNGDTGDDMFMIQTETVLAE